MRVFLLGYSGAIGGASTEAAHTVALFRRFGVNVHLIPTWGQPPADELAKMTVLGCETHVIAGPDAIQDVPDLAGAIVVSFCNDAVFKVWPTLKNLGCRVVWSNCMTYLGAEEKSFLAAGNLFDAYHFQSNFQRECIEPQLTEFGYAADRGFLVHGAFDASGWDFAPTAHEKNTPFVMGKLGQSDPDKWSARLWDIYGKVLYREKRAILMGPTLNAVRKMGGNGPSWAEWLKPCAMSAQEFYARLHVMFTINGGAAENWPRVGLEAMASGCPIVAEDRWGWQEMIVHGETGFLGGTDEELAFFASVLANDERLRLDMARRARERLEALLAHPPTIWQGWQRIFESIGGV